MGGEGMGGVPAPIRTGEEAAGGATYVDATLLLVCVVVDAPPRWLPPGVGGSEFSDESECTLRARLGGRSE